MKKAAVIAAVIIGIIILTVAICYTNHVIQLNREKELFAPLGEMVTVDDRQMSVYFEGDGDKTVVFMSGGGTCSPILDFRSLYSLLSDEYRIVVIEKFGYGFSDVIDEARPIETILEHTRTALAQVGVEGPFILCPHSMSGIEALYWAQKYPDEVSAIVGLDMSVPQYYEEMKINTSTFGLAQFAANVGITRMIPGLSESDAIKGGTLTEREKDIYRAVFYRRTMTDTMIQETLSIKENALIVANGEMPQIPLLLFCSNASGTGFDKDVWMRYQAEFAASCTDAEVIYLDCGHYVHNYEYEQIAEKIKNFI